MLNYIDYENSVNDCDTNREYLDALNSITGKFHNYLAFWSTKEEIASLETELNDIIIKLAKMKQGGFIIMKKEDEEMNNKIENEAIEKQETNTDEKLQNIIKKAKEKGKITYGELASELDDANTEQIDKV